MSDIEPWIESGVSADIAECLHAARRERPRDEVVERCAVLVVAGGLGIAAAAAKGAPIAGSSGLLGASSMLGSAGLLKWGAGGLFAGTVFAAGVHVANVATEPSRPSAPAVSVAPPERQELGRRRPSAPAAPSPHPATPLEPAAPPDSAASVAPRTEAPPVAKAAGASRDQRFAEELALVDRVRASVDAHDPALASALLAEHERRFGKTAQLAPEARALRLEVAVATGRVEEARALAHEMLARDASGPHAVRAREVLKESDPNDDRRR